MHGLPSYAQAKDALKFGVYGYLFAYLFARLMVDVLLLAIDSVK